MLLSIPQASVQDFPCPFVFETCYLWLSAQVMASRDKIYMVMELLTGGELFDKIAADGPMSEKEARKVFQQLLDALDYCHREGVYHRDLKVLCRASKLLAQKPFSVGSCRVSIV